MPTCGGDLKVHQPAETWRSWPTSSRRPWSRECMTSWVGPAACTVRFKPLNENSNSCRFLLLLGKRTPWGPPMFQRPGDPRVCRKPMQYAWASMPSLEVRLARHFANIVRLLPGVSKLCEGMYTRILGRELSAQGLAANVCCPGWCATDMSSWSGPKTALEGADTPVWLALAPPGGPSGCMYAERQQISF